MERQQAMFQQRKLSADNTESTLTLRGRRGVCGRKGWMCFGERRGKEGAGLRKKVATSLPKSHLRPGTDAAAASLLRACSPGTSDNI